MPIDLLKIDQRLIDAARTGTLVPFVGAGVSRHAITSDPKAFPTWRDLLKELEDLGEVGEFISVDERQQIDELVGQGKFLMAAQALRSALPPDAIDRLFRERFQPEDARPGELHRWLVRLKAPLIITTNYDFLLEDAYAEEYKKSAQHLTYKEAAVIQRLLQSHKQWYDRPNIFKIHGSAHSPGEAILSELDYRHLLYRE